MRFDVWKDSDLKRFNQRWSSFKGKILTPQEEYARLSSFSYSNKQNSANAWYALSLESKETLEGYGPFARSLWSKQYPVHVSCLWCKEQLIMRREEEQVIFLSCYVWAKRESHTFQKVSLFQDKTISMPFTIEKMMLVGASFRLVCKNLLACPSIAFLFLYLWFNFYTEWQLLSQIWTS